MEGGKNTAWNLEINLTSKRDRKQEDVPSFAVYLNYLGGAGNNVSTDYFIQIRVRWNAIIVGKNALYYTLCNLILGS